MNYCRYLVFIFTILACQDLRGKPGMSENINESKKRGVFINEYQSNKNLIINETFKMNVVRAWLEKKWAYNSNPNHTIVVDGYQLIVHTTERLDENYSFTWTIGTDFKRNFRSCGYRCIITDFDSLPNKHETWKVQRGRSLYNSASNIVIGEFTLNKK